MDNFYVVYGIDKGLIKSEVDNIIKKISNSEIIKYDIVSTDISDVIEDASTVSLFSKNKVFILDDAFFLTNKNIDKIEELEHYIEHYNPDSYCIFICYSEKLDARKKINKLLSKHKVIEGNKADIKYLNDYVKANLDSDNYKMEDIDFFLKRVGSNIFNINNELDKLKMKVLDSKVITNEDIDKVTNKVMEDEIFTLTDAIILKDTNKALSLLDEFLNQNYDEIQIMMLLFNQFHFLYQVKRLLNKSYKERDIADTLEVNPYRVKYSIKKLYSYSELDLLNYIKRLAKMDHDIKLGLMDKSLALKLFILYC